MRFMDYFKNRPLQTGLLLLAAYFVYFIYPDAFGPTSFGRGKGLDTVADMGELLFPELGLVVSILLVVGIFGWWKACGFTLKTNKGGMKFILPPFIFTLLILTYSDALARSDGQSIISLIGPGPLTSLILVTLLIGIFEESLFRGVVFMGWEKHYGPVLALFVSSVFFGLYHFVNWATGQPLTETIWQVVQAFSMGVMYAALRLRIGSIFLVMILHGFWNATVTIMGSASAPLLAKAADTLVAAPMATSGDGSLVFMVLFYSLEPAYGLFVLWRWNVWRKQQGCPASAPLRQLGNIEPRRISGSS